MIPADSLTYERSFSVDEFQTCICEPVLANNSKSLLVSLCPKMQEPFLFVSFEHFGRPDYGRLVKYKLRLGKCLVENVNYDA